MQDCKTRLEIKEKTWWGVTVFLSHNINYVCVCVDSIYLLQFPCKIWNFLRGHDPEASFQAILTKGIVAWSRDLDRTGNTTQNKTPRVVYKLSAGTTHSILSVCIQAAMKVQRGRQTGQRHQLVLNWPSVNSDSGVTHPSLKAKKCSCDL